MSLRIFCKSVVGVLKTKDRFLFFIQNNLKNIVDMEVVMIEFNKPETICNVTQCSSDPCKNQGKCLTTDSGFTCQCPRGWVGNTCDEDVDECKTG